MHVYTLLGKWRDAYFSYFSVFVYARVEGSIDTACYSIQRTQNFINKTNRQ